MTTDTCNPGLDNRPGRNFFSEKRIVGTMGKIWIRPVN